MMPPKVPGVLDPTVMMSSQGGVDSTSLRRLERLRQAAEDMEAVFMHHLTSAMRATVPGGGHPDAPGADMYASMLDEHLADALAADTNTGIAEALYRQLSANFGLDVAVEPVLISERSELGGNDAQSRATSSSEGV